MWNSGSLNPHVEIIAHIEPILPSNAISLLESYSLILDCTDRPTTRYLMSDAAVRLGIVLVSGAAISMGGQWSVYGGHHRAGIPPPRTERTADYTVDASGHKRRPCYRCIWPKPLPQTGGPGAGTCEEEGVFGPVVGIVGVQMASEAMKVILGLDGVFFRNIQQGLFSVDSIPLLNR
jgi:adenylyltransferase/sulfurtransferase